MKSLAMQAADAVPWAKWEQWAEVSLEQFAAEVIRLRDAERGKGAVAWFVNSAPVGGNPHYEQIATEYAGGIGTFPLFLSPTIPEGMALVDKKLLATAIELVKEASETEFERQPLSEELYGLALMLAERKGAP